MSSHLDRIWSENANCAVLFQWVTFLEEESLQSLGMDQGLNVGTLVDREREKRRKRRREERDRERLEKRRNEKIALEQLKNKIDER